MPRKKLRVIVRPWQPRNLPFPISQAQLKEFIQTHVDLFQEVIYLGWIRRIEKNKRVVKFIVSTGSTRMEAKQRFKESTQFGREIWEITTQKSSNTQSVDPAELDLE